MKHACLHGIPDSLRAETWRCLLGLVELSEPGLDAREASKKRKRTQYYDLAEELLRDAAASPTTNTTDPAALPGTSKRSPQLVWLDDIDKDVRRTQSGYAFFSQRSSASAKSANARILFDKLDEMHPHRQEEITERYNLRDSCSPAKASSSASEEPEGDRHFECLIRLLYIFALLNPVHYVQGMSELVAPLYYIFAQRATISQSITGASEPQEEHAEADAFWAFSTLMSEIGDFYVQDSDGSMQNQDHLSVDTNGNAGSRTGLGATLRRYARQLHWLDGELAYTLHRKMEVQPTFYALRWVTCLLAMEFSIPDLVRIWDTFFALMAGSSSSTSPSKLRSGSRSTADSQARDFILDVCCAMVLHKRQEIMSGNVSWTPTTFELYTYAAYSVLVLSWYPAALYVRQYGCSDRAFPFYTRKADICVFNRLGLFGLCISAELPCSAGLQRWDLPFYRRRLASADASQRSKYSQCEEHVSRSSEQ